MALVYADTSFFNDAATIVIINFLSSSANRPWFALCISQAMMDSLIGGHILSIDRLIHELHKSRKGIGW